MQEKLSKLYNGGINFQNFAIFYVCFCYEYIADSG